MKTKTIGFLGLGTMGFPICYGLYKKGYHMILPVWRRERDEGGHFIPLAANREQKAALYQEMLDNGCEGASDAPSLFRGSDIILLSLPTSAQVEAAVLGEDGLLMHARAKTAVVDLTSADPSSTRRISARCEEKGIDYLDCPVSGGYQGATMQTLSVMAGGKREVFEALRPLLETIGKKEKVVYLGPSGAGDVMKCANNFLSAACLLASTEALCVLAKAGIDPQKAAEVIAASGGSSAAVNFKYPEILFPGRPMGMSVDMILKDAALFVAAAKEAGVPAWFGSLAYQLLGMPSFAGRGGTDWSETVRQYEDWCGVQLVSVKPEKMSGESEDQSLTERR